MFYVSLKNDAGNIIRLLSMQNKGDCRIVVNF